VPSSGIRRLGPGDYLAEIKTRDQKTGKTFTLTVRVVYVYRPGFRRRRLVTSLLDPVLYPAAELAELYHRRWTIETFYRDFKVTMQANRWHCQTPENFEKELVTQMIVVCLIRLAMSQAAKAQHLDVGRLSFARALTRTRSFFKTITCQLIRRDFAPEYALHVAACGRHHIRIKPNRVYSRDQQVYRRKARGLIRGKVGRPRKLIRCEIQPEPEMLTNCKNESYLLS
jgi:hypothetical protein